MSCCLKTSLLSLQTFCRYASRRKICQSATRLALTVPHPEGQEKPPSPKLEQIVTSITQLNLLEVAELNDLLKKRLNLPDVPVMGFGGFAPGMGPAAAAAPEEAEQESKQVAFTVKLVKFDENQKIALIKEVKNSLEGMNLVQAKKFVESLPNVVRSDVGKDEAEKLKAVLEKVGGVCEII